MTGLVWTSITSALLGAIAVLIGIVALIGGFDTVTPLVIALSGASISLAILATREE